MGISHITKSWCREKYVDVDKRLKQHACVLRSASTQYLWHTFEFQNLLQSVRINASLLPGVLALSTFKQGLLLTKVLPLRMELNLIIG